MATADDNVCIHVHMLESKKSLIT